MNSCLYSGWVRHRRFRPVEHEFRYSVTQLYLDLGELDDVFRGRWLWSTRRPALVRFKRSDHLGDPRLPLDVAVRDLVEGRTGVRPAGPIRLLTYPRYFGYVMNPVSFYYCLDAGEGRLESLVAEVNNTPWGERHCYVLSGSLDEGQGSTSRYRFAKGFHVSPFMGMDHDYDWRFTAPGSRVAVHMENHDAGGLIFNASMSLARRPITGRELARALARHPFMTGKVVAAIYWQALRLCLKGAPLHSHPKNQRRQEAT